MVELIALWMACKNIGAIARSRGVPVHPFQVRAVVLWFVFELICGFIAAALGMPDVMIYLAALAGALLSLRYSFGAVNAASSNRNPPAAPDAG